jgi:hypothetical protein
MTMTLRLTDLTDDQRCVLLNAVEETYLFGILNECAPGQDWSDRLPHIPHLAEIVEDFMDKGLVSLTRDAEENGQPPVDIAEDEARAIIADPDNWWSAEGGRPISLVVTDKGLAVYHGEEVDAGASE